MLTPLKSIAYHAPTLFTYTYVALSCYTITLSTQQKLRTWPLNILRKTLSLTIYYQRKLYIKSILDLLLITKALYALYRWQAKTPKKPPLQITNLPQPHTTTLLLISLLHGLLLGYLFATYSNAKAPYLDGLHAAFVLTTYALLAHKKVQAWGFWIIANLCYIHLFTLSIYSLPPTKQIHQDIPLLIKCICYTSLAIHGWYKWSQKATPTYIKNTTII